MGECVNPCLIASYYCVQACNGDASCIRECQENENECKSKCPCFSGCPAGCPCPGYCEVDRTCDIAFLDENLCCEENAKKNREECRANCEDVDFDCKEKCVEIEE